MHNGIPSMENSSLVPQEAKIKFPYNLGGCSPNESKGVLSQVNGQYNPSQVILGRSDSTELDKPKVT